MKIRLTDRIICGLLALILLCCAAAIVAQTFFGLPVAEKISNIFMTPETTLHKILLVSAFVLILLFSVYCFTVLFRHKSKNRKFLSQTTEGGELDISLEALNSLISKCLEQHPELNAEKVILDNEKNSLFVRIIGEIAGGISIPLTVSQLQKQIKQYVTACSGIEVREVKVTVRSSGEEAKDAPFAIEAPSAIPRLKAASENEPDTEENFQVKDVESVSFFSPLTAQEPEPEKRSHIFDTACDRFDDQNQDDDDRPLHQRIFSQPEELCFVPGPENRNKEETISEDVDNASETVNAADESPETVESEEKNNEPGQNVSGYCTENTDSDEDAVKIRE